MFIDGYTSLAHDTFELIKRDLVVALTADSICDLGPFLSEIHLLTSAVVS